MRGRSQPVWLMELLQRLLNNPLNLDLIPYPCSEHAGLRPRHYLSHGALSECGVLEDWAERLLSSSCNSNNCNVELSPAWSVMAKQAQLFTSRYIIPTAANWKHAHVSASLLTQGGKEGQRSQVVWVSSEPLFHSYVFICILTNVHVVVNKEQCIEVMSWAAGWCKSRKKEVMMTYTFVEPGVWCELVVAVIKGYIHPYTQSQEQLFTFTMAKK